MVQNFLILGLILLALFLGFCLPVSSRWVALSERLLSYLVFVILFVIGFELAHIENLWQQLASIGFKVGLLASLTIGFGVGTLIVFDRVYPAFQKAVKAKESVHKVNMWGSVWQMACLVIGVCMGHFLGQAWILPKHLVSVLLMVLIFLVGMGLRASQVSLRSVLLNPWGVWVTLVFVISVLFSGMVFAYLMPDVSLAKGLALASGFGWYSLSGVVITEAYGAVWGSVALFNDLVRELFSLLFIPVIMRISPSAGVSVGGATSLDFTLPVIQQSGGNEVVPLVISFGFLINLLSPILMVFFSRLEGIL